MKILSENKGLLVIYAIFLIFSLILVNDVKNENNEVNNKMVLNS